jgi:hypothetical protein
VPTEKIFDFASNDLPYLRASISVPGLKHPVSVIDPVFGLVDANVMLSTISARAQRNNPAARTNLEEAVDAGILRLFATTQAREEVLRHLPTYPCKAPPERIESAKKLVLGRIYVVAPQQRTSVNIERLGKRDRSDVPHAQLFEELGLDIILSRDEDWAATDYPRFGYGDEDLLLFLRNYARAAAEHRGLHGVVAGGAVVTVAAARGLYDLFKQFPLWGKCLTVGGAVLALIGAVAEASPSSSPQTRDADPPVPDIFTRMHESGERSAELASRITKLLERRDTLTLNQHLLRILALADEPLELRELEQQLLRAGHKSAAKDFTVQLLRALRANRIFAMSDASRWQMRTPLDIEETKTREEMRNLRASWRRRAQ